MTSPPLTSQTLDVSALKAKLVYIRLHGVDGQPFLYGDPGMMTALSADQIENADFEGCHIFLEGCNGDELASAFLAAGALSVTGSSEPTYGRRWHTGPSSVLGREWITNMRLGYGAEKSLEEARNLVPAKYKDGWVVRKKL